MDLISSDSSLKTALMSTTKSRRQYTPLNITKSKSTDGNGRAILGEDVSPSLTKRKRFQTSKAVIVSSDGSSDDEISQRSCRPGRSDSMTQSPTQSRPTFFPRVDPLHFILGGTTSSAPVRGSRRRTIVTPTSSKTLRASTRGISSSNHHSPTSKHSNQKAAAKPKSQTSSKRRSARLSMRVMSPTVDDSSSATEVEQAPKTSSRRTTRLISEDDSDVVLTGARPRSGGTVQQESTADTLESEDSDDDVVLSPTKRKRLVRPGQQFSQEKVWRQEDKDLEEDLEILRDTGMV